MKKPEVQRDGDTWMLAWPDQQIGFEFERLHETRDGLRAEVQVESLIDGRILGPAFLNILSSESQTRFANVCEKRVNGLSKEDWHAIVIQACAIVATEYREPTPLVDLSTEPDEGPIEYLDDVGQYRKGLGLLPKNETIVMYGDGESAKSLMALRISLSVALGHELPWGPTPVVGNVLYLDWETNQRTVATRLRRLAHGECCETPRILYQQCFRGLSDELPHIKERISKHRISLVVVDSIGYAATGALTDDETARTAMNALRSLGAVTRLVVAHISKADAESNGRAKPFGSQFFWNSLRSGIEMRRSLESTTDNVIDLGVIHQKANDGRHVKPFAMTVTFDTDSDGILFTRTNIADVPDLAARAPLGQRIRAMLTRSDKTADELAETLDVSPKVIRVTLERMQGVQRLHQGGGRGNPTRWGLSEHLP